MAAKKKAEETPVLKITGRVIADLLNVRNKASLDGKVVKQLPKDTELEILETLDGWYKIKGGFVMAKWVELDA